MSHAEINPFFVPLRGGLIVSCQAQPGEPLHSSFIMARMAVAAKEGGAIAIRCESPSDIAAIREAVPDLPIVGLWKVTLPGYEKTVYITPRLQDAQAVADAGADVIALDATRRPHPENRTTAELIRAVKETTGKLVMADIDNEAAALIAIEAGADCVSTTLSGYTDDSPKREAPDFALIQRLVAMKLPVPVIAEGRIHTPEMARQALDYGAFAVVVGGAITRPQQITARFAKAVHGR